MQAIGAADHALEVMRSSEFTIPSQRKMIEQLLGIVVPLSNQCTGVRRVDAHLKSTYSTELNEGSMMPIYVEAIANHQTAFLDRCITKHQMAT